MQLVDMAQVRRVLDVVRRDEVAKSEIAASWRRCLMVHKIDPTRPAAARVLTEAELKEASEPIMPILRVAEPEIDRLFRLVRGAGYIILVSDYRGIAIAERATEENCGPAGKRPMLGTVWDESVEGTNGLGTALANKRQVLVRRSEHLHTRNTGMICAAAPIYNHDGKLSGAIDITTFRSEASDSYLPLALAVVTDAARRIEARCFSRAHPNEMILSLPNCENAGGSVPLIAVNTDHFVVGATRAARLAWHLTDDTLRDGVPLREVVPEAERESPKFADAERFILQQALASSKKISSAASALGISRTTMYRKMKRLAGSGTVFPKRKRRDSSK